ncbi:protein of unknown function (DUF1540) [Halobacteroides halobius DSM 5150]|uniref:DUF1540 domain-containing protein n=1 Tax=Halobacteroides halobius (strain ATCC 35273 / DSM 5150 / MD-1) TaxID=748449 RepID=L0K732_HALHC|nr:DUF1540 domain-containing protein [Halobacteroides halobius]AGB41097.1 protein of unknown function (DUF1540) [Halobacteroides halobius DSM 5150]
MANINCIVDSCAHNADGMCGLDEIQVTADDNGQFARRAKTTKCQSFARE